jgi:hypothetical protein
MPRVKLSIEISFHPTPPTVFGIAHALSSAHSPMIGAGRTDAAYAA